jgi:hypothetical protein
MSFALEIDILLEFVKPVNEEANAKLVEYCSVMHQILESCRYFAITEFNSYAALVGAFPGTPLFGEQTLG